MSDSSTREGIRKRVLFVCVENSCRSQLAEAFAHLHGGAAIAAYSAGSRPSGQVNPKAIAAMQELNYDLSRHQSKSLAEVPEVEYDYAITMGCGDECPLVRAAVLRRLFVSVSQLDQRRLRPGAARERDAYRQAEDETCGHGDVRITRNRRRR